MWETIQLRFTFTDIKTTHNYYQVPELRPTQLWSVITQSTKQNKTLFDIFCSEKYAIFCSTVVCKAWSAIILLNWEMFDAFQPCTKITLLALVGTEVEKKPVGVISVWNSTGFSPLTLLHSIRCSRRGGVSRKKKGKGEETSNAPLGISLWQPSAVSH